MIQVFLWNSYLANVHFVAALLYLSVFASQTDRFKKINANPYFDAKQRSWSELTILKKDF